MITYNVPQGENFSDALKTALNLAEKMRGFSVQFDFNGVLFSITMEKGGVMPGVYGVKEPDTEPFDVSCFSDDMLINEVKARLFGNIPFNMELVKALNIFYTPAVIRTFKDHEIVDEFARRCFDAESFIEESTIRLLDVWTNED